MAADSILRVDSSGRHAGSATRLLADYAIDRLLEARPQRRVIVRDLLGGDLPCVDAQWMEANTASADRRTSEQREALALSDALIGELRASSALVIGVPVYNFNIPAALKAWIDHICRARETFRYTGSGPVGLLSGTEAIVIVASAGTALGGDTDFATPYLRHILRFVGIDPCHIVDAGRLLADREQTLQAARRQIDDFIASRLRPRAMTPSVDVAEATQ